MGSAHPLAAPYQAVPTADGWINVGASNEATWRGLTRAVESEALAQEARFETNAARMENLDELIDVLTAFFVTRSSDVWLDRLAAEGVPAGPIASVGEMLEHPQTLAREMVVEVEHSQLGPVRSLGSPVKMSASGASPDGGRGAPLLGQHTREVLGEAEYGVDEIEEMVGAGVVVG